MKIFQYKLHGDVKLGIAKDEKDAFDRRAEIDRAFQFLPVKVEELTFEGYEVLVKPIEPPNTVEEEQQVELIGHIEHRIESMSRDELKEWLTEKGVEFTPQLGEVKLRELALQHV